MMQIVILAIGKESSKELRQLELDYEKRLRSHTAIEWKLLPASRLKEPEAIRRGESEQISRFLKPTDTVVLLDERGEQQTNEQFATTFGRLTGTQGRLIIIIGGAFGVTEEIRIRANFVWSLSKLVFPHQLIRVMLLEQIYRTFMVQQNHPYHHP